MSQTETRSREEQLRVLDEDRAAGRITAFEYQSRRKELEASAAAPAPEPVQPEVEAPKPPKALSGWGAQESRGGIKHWSSAARDDEPDARKVLPALAKGIGSGKSFFFLFGLKRFAEIDQKMLASELEHIDDDIEVLRNAGYTVVVDTQATREDFIATVTGQGEGAEGLAPAGFYWSAHGNEDGSVECCDGTVVRPDDIDAARVLPSLRLAIFGACYVGSRARTWRKALGGHPLVVGWGRPVTIGRAVEFLEPDPETETDLDDLIRRYLLTDVPLPGTGSDRYSPVASAHAAGRAGDLPERIQIVSSMLGAKWREADRCVEILVSLHNDRTHVAKVFVIDGTEPYNEGEPLLAAEADVGELSAVVDPAMLLSGLGGPGYARVMLVKSETEMPRIVTQGFLPLMRVRDQDLAALIYQVCQFADTLELRIFGSDLG